MLKSYKERHPAAMVIVYTQHKNAYAPKLRASALYVHNEKVGSKISLVYDDDKEFPELEGIHQEDNLFAQFEEDECFYKVCKSYDVVSALKISK